MAFGPLLLTHASLLAALELILAPLGSLLVRLEPLRGAREPLVAESYALLGRSGCDPGGYPNRIGATQSLSEPLGHLSAYPRD